MRECEGWRGCEGEEEKRERKEEGFTWWEGKFVIHGVAEGRLFIR